MRHIWTVLCKQSITDVRTNNVSLIESLERIQFPNETEQVRGLNLVFEIISMWWRTDLKTPEQGIGQVMMLSPKKEKLLEYDIEINLKDHQKSRSSLIIQGIPFDGFGIYEFIIQVKTNDSDWIKVSETPLEILQTPKSRE